MPAWWCALAEQIGPYADSYRLVLVSPENQRILVHRAPLDVPNRTLMHPEISLPRVSISKWSRTAAQVQSWLRQRWNIRAVVIDCPYDSARPEQIAIAEIIERDSATLDIPGMEWVSLSEIPVCDFKDSESAIRSMLESLIQREHMNNAPFLRLGWTRDLLDWTRSIVPEQQRSNLADIEQLNASSHHALLRIKSGHGRTVWFKAAAAANDPEFETTLKLNELFPEYLPTILASRLDWRGWLMADAGSSAEKTWFPSSRSFERIGRNLARFQQASIPFVGDLMNVGLADQRIPTLRATVAELMPCFEEAVLFQRPAGIPQILLWKLREIANTFDEAFGAIEEIGLPDTLVHNDLNPGNILMWEGDSVFTDWADASVGNPFVAIDQLQIYFNQNARLSPELPRIIHAYSREWYGGFSQKKLDTVVQSVRLLSLAAHLTSRKQWIISEYRRNPAIQSYLRSMARQMYDVTQSENGASALRA